MALCCRANRAEQCRLSGVDRPTYAQCEFFAFWTQLRHRRSRHKQVLASADAPRGAEACAAMVARADFRLAEAAVPDRPRHADISRTMLQNDQGESMKIGALSRRRRRHCSDNRVLRARCRPNSAAARCAGAHDPGAGHGEPADAEDHRRMNPNWNVFPKTAAEWKVQVDAAAADRRSGCRRCANITLPPPGRFSIMIGWPSALLTCGSMMRARSSVPPPCSNGTTRRIGRDGPSLGPGSRGCSKRNQSAQGKPDPPHGKSSAPPFECYHRVSRRTLSQGVPCNTSKRATVSSSPIRSTISPIPG